MPEVRSANAMPKMAATSMKNDVVRLAPVERRRWIMFDTMIVVQTRKEITPQDSKTRWAEVRPAASRFASSA